MNIRDILTSGGIVLVLMTLVQITPIKVNPWSAIWNGIKGVFSTIGTAMNKRMIEELGVLEKKVDVLDTKLCDHEREREIERADDRRADILRFNREVIRGLPHTMEDFIEVLSYIDFYESYCKDHPEYENNRAVMAIQNIERAYKKHLEDNNFTA